VDVPSSPISLIFWVELVSTSTLTVIYSPLLCYVRWDDLNIHVDILDGDCVVKLMAENY
jgi:hypothetical protein